MEIQDIYLALFDYDNLLLRAKVYYSFLVKSNKCLFSDFMFEIGQYLQEIASFKCLSEK